MPACKITDRPHQFREATAKQGNGLQSPSLTASVGLFSLRSTRAAYLRVPGGLLRKSVRNLVIRRRRWCVAHGELIVLTPLISNDSIDHIDANANRYEGQNEWTKRSSLGECINKNPDIDEDDRARNLSDFGPNRSAGWSSVIGIWIHCEAAGLVDPRSLAKVRSASSRPARTTPIATAACYRRWQRMLIPPSPNTKKPSH